MWTDENMERVVNKAVLNNRLSLLVKTRNYKEGETITIKIKEKNNRDVTNNSQDKILTGIVDKNGFAFLKESFLVELSDREEEDRKKEEEERRMRRELFSRYNMFEEIK